LGKKNPVGRPQEYTKELIRNLPGGVVYPERERVKKGGEKAITTIPIIFRGEVLRN